LSTYEPIILDGIRLARANTLVNTRSLRTYFPTTIFPRNPRLCASTINPRLHCVHDAGLRVTRRGRLPRQLTAYPTVLQFFRLMFLIPTIPIVPPTLPPPDHPPDLDTFIGGPIPTDPVNPPALRNNFSPAAP
jgi:hypothetical protein